MSEVDSLSNSGLYPALPIADQQHKDGAPRQAPRGQRPAGAATDVATSPHDAPRMPKSVIDDYA